MDIRSDSITADSYFRFNISRHRPVVWDDAEDMSDLLKNMEDGFDAGTGGESID